MLSLIGEKQSSHSNEKNKDCRTEKICCKKATWIIDSQVAKYAAKLKEKPISYDSFKEKYK